MTQDEYVESILNKYQVATGPNSPAERVANVIIPSLKQWAGLQLAGIQFSGSYAKSTAVSIGTDVDLFISLKSTTAGTLKEIYDSLFNAASKAGWTPRRQNVSIGISHSGLDIDLTPGRIQEGYQNYHSLYRRRVDSWTQTNVALHVQTIRNSGRTREIRAIKVWRQIQSLDFPSFLLELTVLEALKGRRQDTLAANVLAALSFIGENLPSLRLVDPANSNNVVSSDLTANEKSTISQKAATSAKQPSWSSILW